MNKENLKKYLEFRVKRECDLLGRTDTNEYVLSMTHDQKLEIALDILEYEKISAKIAG